VSGLWQVIWPWIGPLIFGLAAGVWALRPSMKRRMLFIEIATGLVLFDAYLVYSEYANATLLAGLVGGRVTYDLWGAALHLLYLNVVVVAGAWIGWRARPRPV